MSLSSSCSAPIGTSVPLQSVDYDKVDWNEDLDEYLDRDAEERWFDDEEED